MPIYEYECSLCGREFEMILFSSDDESKIECPDCGGTKVKKRMSRPAASHGSCESCSSSGHSCSSCDCCQ